MKTFQQFQEDARSAGATVRQGIDKAVSATYNFGKGFFTGKSGTKPGSAQHRGAQLRKAGDRAAEYGATQSAANQDRRNELIKGGIRNTTDFVKGLVTGKGSKKKLNDPNRKHDDPNVMRDGSTIRVGDRVGY